MQQATETMSIRPSRRRQIVLAAFSLAMLGAMMAHAQRAGVEDEGRERFVAYGCYQCHGYEGQGGAALRIAPTVYPFEAFAVFVRKPPSEMPAYSAEMLSEQDLRLIYEYARSRPEPRPAEDLSALTTELEW